MRFGSPWSTGVCAVVLASLAGCVILPFPYDDFAPSASSGSVSVIPSGASDERHQISFQSGRVYVAVQMFQRDDHAWAGVDVYLAPGTRASFVGPTLTVSTSQGVFIAPLKQAEPPRRPLAAVDGLLEGLPDTPGSKGRDVALHAAIRTPAPLADEYELQLPDLQVEGEPVFHFPPIRFTKSSHIGWAVPL